MPTKTEVALDSLDKFHAAFQKLGLELTLKLHFSNNCVSDWDTKKKELVLRIFTKGLSFSLIVKVLCNVLHWKSKVECHKGIVCIQVIKNDY